MIRNGGKLPPDVHRKTPLLVEKIARDSDIAALFAFGSFADDKLKPLSDLDFAVLLRLDMSPSARFDKHLELIGLFNETYKTDEIDPVVLNDAPLRFAHTIIKTGRLLHIADKAALIDFYDRISKLYLDFRYFRDQFDEAFLEGIGYDG